MHPAYGSRSTRAALGSLLRLTFVLTIVFSFILAQVSPSSAALEYIRISKIDTTFFPDVTIRAIARDGNFNPLPVADLAALQVLEEGNPVKGNLPKEVKQGLDLVFLMDIGLGVNANGLSGNARYIEMRDIVSRYLDQMDPDDQAAILLVDGSNASVPQPLTSDTGKVRQSLTDVVKQIEAKKSFSPGWTTRGVSSALDELAKSSRLSEHIQTIVVLSSGQQEGGADRNTLITKARSAGVKIHAVISNVKDNDPVRQESINHVKELSDGTGGMFTYYTGTSAVEPLFTWFNNQRTAFEVTYRSTLGSSQSRTVQLSMKGGASATGTYQVKLSSPVVVIDKPENNMEIVRKLAAGSTTMENADPKDLQVQVHLEWPNEKQQRKITEAELYVNDQKTGAPQTFPGNQFTFIFPLTELRTAGTTTFSFQVQVKDELGLIGKSEPIIAKVHVEVPNTPTGPIPTVSPCASLTGVRKSVCDALPVLNNVSGMIALGVALLTLILVVVFRRQIGQGVSDAYVGVRETIVRLTRPANSEVGAYLKVMKGDPTVMGKSIPISLGTPTPIGRERGKCEILFDEAIDNSVVSRVHCVIRENAGKFTVRDMGSTYGTFLNSKRLEDGVENPLEDGDEIEIGPSMRGGYLLKFELAHSAESSSQMSRNNNGRSVAEVSTETKPYRLTDDDEPDTTTRAHPFN